MEFGRIERNVAVATSAVALSLGITACSKPESQIEVPADAQQLGKIGSAQVGFLFSGEARGDAVKVDCGEPGRARVDVKNNGDVVVVCWTSTGGYNVTEK